MIFGSPLAWLGLGALVLPLVVHMLVRERARIQRLPTLRFLKGEPPVAIRRSRPDEPLLLGLRLLLLAVAVFALAQPFLPFGDRAAAAAGARESLSRVVLVDRGEEGALAGEGLAAMQALVAEVAGEADRVRVLPFDGGPGASPARDLAAAVEGARGWLDGAPGRREVVVVSDFAGGLPDPGVLRRIPDEAGLRLVGAPAGGSSEPPTWTLPARSGTVEVAWYPDLEGAASPVPGARVEWRATGFDPDADGGAEGLTLVSGEDPGVRERARRALEISSAVGGLRVGAETPVVVVFGAGSPASDPEASALLGAATPPSARWTADALLALAGDPELLAALRELRGETGSEVAAGAPVPLFRGADGGVLLGAGELPADPAAASGAPRLLLVYAGDPGDLAAPALLGALGRAMAAPAVVGRAGSPAPTEALRALDRDPAPVDEDAPAARGGGPLDDTDPFPSDARWAWLLVLGLLVGEGFLRRGIEDRRKREVSDDAS